MAKLYEENDGRLELDIEKTRENLVEFAQKIREDAEEEEVQDYKLAVLQASNSLASRQKRENILKRLIVLKRR
jgi:hypothetical protein